MRIFEKSSGIMSQINILVNRVGSANLFYHPLRHQLIFELIFVGSPIGSQTQPSGVASAYSYRKQSVYTSVRMTRNSKADIFLEPSS